MKILLSITLAALPAFAHGQLSSGEYNGLLLAVDHATGIITGYYENHAGADPESGEPMFSCIFYLRGDIAGEPPYAVTTWYPGETDPNQVIAGTLAIAPPESEPEVTLKLADEHGGCGNVDHFAEDSGAFFPLGGAGDWREIRIVAKKACLHGEPSDSNELDVCLAAGEPVQVLESRSGWVRILSPVEADAATQMWLKENVLHPAMPPETDTDPS